MLTSLLLAAALARPVRAGWLDAPERWLPSHAVAASALPQLVGDARVVALADATHGTHELFAAKQQLVPLLAASGFRTIAFEAPYAEWQSIDAGGDPAQAIDSDDYFFWNAGEVLDLIRWARAQDPPLHIAAIDCAHPFSTARYVIARVEPSLQQTVTDRYACLMAYEQNPNGYSAKSAVDRQACRASVLSVRPLITDPELAHAARVVEQGEESLATLLANRDAAMAENLEWLADRDGKVIVLGHNEHFGRTAYSLTGGPPVKSAGAYVAEQLPYFALGTLILQGTYNAYETDASTGITAVKPNAMGAPSADDYALLFQRSALPSVLVSLRPPLPAWLATPHHLRIAPSSGPTLNLFEDVAAKFDALLYFETSTPTLLRRYPVAP
jgi:erythromycin esterase